MCDACKDTGWLHAVADGDKHTVVKHEIQRCDDCEMIAHDDAAVIIHKTACGCDWVNRALPVPEKPMPPFNVSERARSLGKTIGNAIGEELSHPITGWVAPYVHTAVCDGIAHELRRVVETVKDCGPCAEKIKELQAEALQQRFIV